MKQPHLSGSWQYSRVSYGDRATLDHRLAQPPSTRFVDVASTPIAAESGWRILLASIQQDDFPETKVHSSIFNPSTACNFTNDKLDLLLSTGKET